MFAGRGLVSQLGRAGVIAGIAASVVTAIPPSPAIAAPASKHQGVAAGTGAGGATDFSARRRYYRGGGGAAAAAAFAGIVGTGIAIAAANSRRNYYYEPYGYYGGPYGYYGGPGYYSAPGYYYGRGPAYYGGYRSPY